MPSTCLVVKVIMEYEVLSREDHEQSRSPFHHLQTRIQMTKDDDCEGEIRLRSKDPSFPLSKFMLENVSLEFLEHFMQIR